MTSPYGTRRSMIEQPSSSTTTVLPIQIASRVPTNSSQSRSLSNSNSQTTGGSSFLSTSNSKSNHNNGSSSSISKTPNNKKSTSRRRLSTSSSSNSTLPGISSISINSVSTAKLARAALQLELDDEDDGEVKMGDKLSLKERKHLFECEICNKVYRHSTCLVKHRWEHTAHWKEASKLLLSKHEQTKLLEASAILTALTAGSSLPDEKSYWPAAVSPPSSGLLGSQSLNISVLTSPRSYPSQSLRLEYDPSLSHFILDEQDELGLHDIMDDSMNELSPDLENDNDNEGDGEEGEGESEESASTADDLAEGMFEMDIENELSAGGTTSRSGSSVLGEDLDQKSGYSSEGGGGGNATVLLRGKTTTTTPALGFFPIVREVQG